MVKNQLLELTPYQPGENPEDIKRKYQLDKVVKLASNENPYGCSKNVLEVIQKSQLIFSSYPDGSAHELRKKLAKHLEIHESEIMFGSGLDDVIQIISRALLCKQNNIVTAKDTFPQYKHNAIIEGCEVREVPLVAGKYDLNSMTEKIDVQTKLVWICNPNNPTGTYICENDLKEFLDTVPKETIVVLDEAYFEYVQKLDYPNSIPLIKEYPNILILRTFSKAYGLAGCRIGYAIGNEDLIKQLNIVRLPFNTSILAQLAALSAIGDQTFLTDCIKKNTQELKRYQAFFEKYNVSYYPSVANFIFLCTDQSKDWFHFLLQKGFIVRPFPNGVRISMGTAEQNKRLLSYLENLFFKKSIK